MRARGLALGWCVGVLSVLPGCGLTLDYGPPDPVRGDAGTIDGGAHDAGGDTGNGGTCETGCDDGLRCTRDSCTDAACTHTDICPTGTECIARGGGECRRACGSDGDCDDGIDCTNDTCAPDGHCAHDSNCDAARPLCLATNTCVPTTCSAPSDCDDGNPCNGVETCTGGVCASGTPVSCDAPVGCIASVCDPVSGTCIPQRDPNLCVDDGFACTIETCGTDGQCHSVPDAAVCLGSDLCRTSICNPDAAIDPSGCDVIATVGCSSPCGTGVCDPATGTCQLSGLCASGQICGAGGCFDPGTCATDLECMDVRDVHGCSTQCVLGRCTPLVCATRMGECGELALDGGCPAGGRCDYVPNDERCTDGDPRSVDRCNPTTFTCEHDCGTPSPSDCVSFRYSAGACLPVTDSSVCLALHGGVPPSRSNCVTWQCVGHGSGADTNGCAQVPSDAACDDGFSCTTDRCMVSAGSGTCRNDPSTDPNVCTDDIDCTLDSCAPADREHDAAGCAHMPDDTVCEGAAGGLECATAQCTIVGSGRANGRPLPSGCTLQYTPLSCVGRICSDEGMCRAPGVCSSNAECDDGNPCNGSEICVARRCAQGAPLSCLPIGLCPLVCTPLGCEAPPILECLGVVPSP